MVVRQHARRFTGRRTLQRMLDASEDAGHCRGHWTTCRTPQTLERILDVRQHARRFTSRLTSRKTLHRTLHTKIGGNQNPRCWRKKMDVQQNVSFSVFRMGCWTLLRATQNSMERMLETIGQDATSFTACRNMHWTLWMMLHAYAAKDALYQTQYWTARWTSIINRTLARTPDMR